METIGFKVIPCGPCVYNKMIRDKQMTITWHVDDLKVFHADKDIVDDFIRWTKYPYEDRTNFNPSTVEIHYYLDIILD